MPWTPYSQRSRPPPGPARPDPGRAGAPRRPALTTQHNDLTIRPITGPDELDLSLPGDLPATGSGSGRAVGPWTRSSVRIQGPAGRHLSAR